MKSKLFIAGLLFISIAAQSQVINQGILYIKAGSDVFYSASDFTNTSLASFTNNGSFYVKGNLSNSQSSMSAGSGTLFLNGSSAQTVNGSQPFLTYNLNTNNSAGITLNNNISVSGTHTFTAGVITTSATPNYLIYESGSSCTGASDTKHVNGWVKKIGSTDFTFPTGNGVYQRDITLQNLSAASEFDVRYSGATFNTKSVLYPIASVNPMEHWTVNKISGGTAQLKLNWDSSKVPFPNYLVPDLRAALYSGSEWTNQGGTASGSVATTGSITSSSLSDFGRMAIGSISFPLPLKFIGISATLENSSVRIKWKTADEVSVDNYNVQRSSDGINFSDIATIKAMNGDLQSYEYLDVNLPSSKLYYRIRSNDIGGKKAYSATVAIKLDNVQRMVVVNNPLTNAIQLLTQNMPLSVYVYELINANGQVCRKGSFSCQGSGMISIPVSTIPPGAYTLVVFKSFDRKEFKLLIK
ncbi:MAG TPA: hypothetical protein VNT20_03540 [Flavisolibacter sp.]|jgi:hypothetical protein|nr:hypothetical protein [Flavisolibacter sp.]